MNIEPLWNHILVQQDEAEEKRGSIILPDDARQKPKRGKVLAVGPGRIDDEGRLVPMSVKEGDRVLFANHAGQEIDLDGKKLMIINDNNVLARIV